MSSLSAEQTRDRALRGGLLFLIARLTLQSFQWVATLFVARLLIPEHYGLMAVVSMMTELGVLLASAGFGSALVQRVHTTREEEGQVFTLSLVFSVLLYGLVWFVAPLIAAHLKTPEFVTFLRVTALVLLLVPLNTVCGAMLERELRFATLAGVQVGYGLLQSIVVLSLAFAGFGVWSLGLGMMSGHLFSTLSHWNRSGWRPHLAIPDSRSTELVRFGATVAATGLVWFVNSNSDKAVVTAILGPALLGLYAMAYQLAAMPVDKITSSINRAAFATYGRLRTEPERLSKWYLRVVAALFATAGPALVGTALIAGDAIPLLLGEKWRELVVPFQILAPAGVIMAIAGTIPPLLTALGRPDIPMKYEFSCAVFYPLAIYLAATFGGVRGVCALWVMVYPFMVLSLVHASRHVTGISIGRLVREIMPFLLALLAMVGAVLLLRSFAQHMSPMPRMVLSIGVGVTVYMAAAVLIVGPNAVMAAIDFLKGLSRKSETSEGAG